MSLSREIPLDPNQAALRFTSGQSFLTDKDDCKIAANRDCWRKNKTDDLVREIREVRNG